MKHFMLWISLVLFSCAGVNSTGVGGGSGSDSNRASVDGGLPPAAMTGEAITAIDSKRNADAGARHELVFTELGQTLAKSGFIETPPDDLKTQFKLRRQVKAKPGVRERYFIGTFKKSAEFVILLIHDQRSEKSRFTVQLFWGAVGAKIEQQRKLVGWFRDDLSIWWAKNDPFHHRRS